MHMTLIQYNKNLSTKNNSTQVLLTTTYKQAPYYYLYDNLKLTWFTVIRIDNPRVNVIVCIPFAAPRGKFSARGLLFTKSLRGKFRARGSFAYGFPSR